MSKAYESIMRGLKEIEESKKVSTTLKKTVLEIKPTPRCNAKAVKRLRHELRLPQTAFARLCGVSNKTVEAWEAGRNEPNGGARRLFEVIENDRGVLERGGILSVT